MQPAVPTVVRFGSSFELRSTERVLLAHGRPLALGSRALDVLVALVARQGALVTKDELLSSAWPGLVVEEANVHVAVSQLRKLLGKAAISTVGGLGYRFALALHADAPAAPEKPVYPGLPQPRTAFVGRQTELADTSAQLQQARLLTLVAMGGMGKTRLALQLAQALQGRYAEGVFFVDLQPLQDGAGLPGAVARALALGTASNDSAAGTEAHTEALLRHLQQRQLLLVLDNCEHLLSAVQTLLSALLARAPGVTVLATSRQALELPGERVYALRPLQLPGAADATAQALACEAVQLFLQRVLADNPGFFATDSTSAALLCDICRRLDGIPLALELAAARMKMLSLPQLHTLLAQRFELLSRSGPGGTTRQQTLQDVLQWSHEHLAPAEQGLAQAVAVCSGGFDLDTAVALVNDAAASEGGAPGAVASGPGPVAVLDSLAQLAERALIHVSHGGENARYGLLETVRVYLLAQLARSGRLQLVRQRHLAHFHRLALQAEQASAAAAPGSADAARWAARLDAERDNLLAALACSQQPGSLSADPQQALEMVAALKNFWFASGWLEQGLGAAAAALAQVPAQQPTLLSARVLRLAAQLCLFMSRLDEGAVYAHQALVASTALGDEAGAAAALCFAGRIAVKSDDTSSGEALLHEGLRRARQVNALAVVGEALNALAFAAIERDDLDAAASHFGEALLASQQRGSALGGVIETLNLAWVAVTQAATRAATRPATVGEPERARQLLLSVWHTLQSMPHRYVAQELVDVCASFALHGGHGDVAALLHGASATQRQALQLPLTAKQAARRASEAAAARAALGEAGYEAASARGRLQTHTQTLAHVGGWLQTVVSQMPVQVAAASALQPATQARKSTRSSGRTPKQPV